MDLSRLLSALLPLLVELLLLVQCTALYTKTSRTRTPQHRGNGSRKLNFLRKLLEEVSSDQSLGGLVRRKKTAGQQQTTSLFPAALEAALLRPDVTAGPLKNTEEDGAFVGSGVEEFGTPPARKNKLNEEKHEENNEYQGVVCPAAVDGKRLISCPSPDHFGVFKCIDDHQVCNGLSDCPHAEDEDGTACMFHKITVNYFHFLMDAVFDYVPS